MNKDYPNEWTQEEFLRNKITLEKEGIKVLLIDTILNPIKHTDTMVYNPVLLKEMPKGSVLVFYCDSGKATMDRLQEYKKKFPLHHCLSLKGGRGNWRKYFQLLDEENKDD
ncbi:hypothetical protein JHD50_05695 [Sulfurimonas sp. MAG313]|nr:hypothetical protein [Sulfurimonas sp. MAG313]MDF1880801.1 hypothetical protein [Sulfurimonas sp. MAG313]